jgi:hypothetical protein
MAEEDGASTPDAETLKDVLRNYPSDLRMEVAKRDDPECGKRAPAGLSARPITAALT